VRVRESLCNRGAPMTFTRTSGTMGLSFSNAKSLGEALSQVCV